VRQSLAAATEQAETERALVAKQEVEAQDGGVPLTPAEAAQARAEIYEEEQNVFDFHRREVYIGFHELEKLLPRDDPPAETQPRFPELAQISSRINARTHQPLPSIPADLISALDSDCCEEMRTRFASRNAWDYDTDPGSHVWWTQILPEFVEALREERDSARAERDSVHAEVRRLIESRDEVRRQRD
jgi:hypothetical protein